MRYQYRYRSFRLRLCFGSYTRHLNIGKLSLTSKNLCTCNRSVDYNTNSEQGTVVRKSIEVRLAPKGNGKWAMFFPLEEVCGLSRLFVNKMVHAVLRLSSANISLKLSGRLQAWDCGLPARRPARRLQPQPAPHPHPLPPSRHLCPPTWLPSYGRSSETPIRRLRLRCAQQEVLYKFLLHNTHTGGLLTWVTWLLISIGPGGSSLEMFLASVASART